MHVIACARGAATAKWEGEHRHRHPDPDTLTTNPLTGRPPAKVRLAPNKIHNGLGDRIGKSCATCLQDRAETVEQRAPFGSRAQASSRAKRHRSLPPRTTAPFWCSTCGSRRQGRQSLRLVEERVINASEGVVTYGVDASVSIPYGELTDDVAVNAPLIDRSRGLSGRRCATTLCVVCERPDSARVDRGKPHNATVEGPEQHLDGCYRTRIRAQDPLIYKDGDGSNTGEASHERPDGERGVCVGSVPTRTRPGRQMSHGRQAELESAFDYGPRWTSSRWASGRTSSSTPGSRRPIVKRHEGEEGDKGEGAAGHGQEFEEDRCEYDDGFLGEGEEGQGQEAAALFWRYVEVVEPPPSNSVSALAYIHLCIHRSASADAVRPPSCHGGSLVSPVVYTQSLHSASSTPLHTCHLAPLPGPP